MQIAQINQNIIARNNKKNTLNSQPSFGAFVNVRSVRKLGPNVTGIISNSVKTLGEMHPEEKGNVVFDLASKFCATLNLKKLQSTLGRRLMVNCTRIVSDGSEVSNKVYVPRKAIMESGTEAIITAAERAYAKGTEEVEKILGQIQAGKNERLSKNLAAAYNDFNG